MTMARLRHFPDPSNKRYAVFIQQGFEFYGHVWNRG